MALDPPQSAVQHNSLIYTALTGEGHAGLCAKANQLHSVRCSNQSSDGKPPGKTEGLPSTENSSQLHGCRQPRHIPSKRQLTSWLSVLK